MYQANGCIDDAWPRMWNADERRAALDSLYKAVVLKEDELTAMHKADADNQQTRQTDAT